MKLKRIRNLSVALFVLSLIMSYAVSESDFWEGVYYKYDFLEGLIQGFFLFSLFTFILTIFLKAAKTFDSWWKFTRVYIPLSFFLILITPGGPSNGLINIDAELVTWWLSGIFLFVSIVLIMVKSRKLRSKGS